MILCTAGAIFLISAALVLGLAMRSAEKRRIHAIERAISIVQHARRKIDFFGTPSAELFLDYPDDGREPLLTAMRQKPLSEALAPLVCEMGAEGELLCAFARRFGSGYKDDTLQLCDFTIATLEKKLLDMQKEYPARAKLCTALPLLFAFSIIVLLV